MAEYRYDREEPAERVSPKTRPERPLDDPRDSLAWLNLQRDAERRLIRLAREVLVARLDLRRLGEAVRLAKEALEWSGARETWEAEGD